MKIVIRPLFKSVLPGAAMLLLAGPALAQSYPSQDIRLICAFPPGSGADVVVRYFAEKLKPVTKRNVLVENRPGAGGNLAMAYVVKQRSDGHVIYLHTGSSMSANMHLYKKPPIDAG
ncbi:MAG: tripartite tricarboxylate transporter substrate binding protein, partial [Alphaproteobacteria bacterium]|nr:tripartite tricarboxylate transporter substrate binding protein [Alphaproteobacteria bacterium]